MSGSPPKTPPSLVPARTSGSPPKAGDALFGSGTFDAEHFGDGVQIALDEELDAGHRTTHSISLKDEEDALSPAAARGHSPPARTKEPERQWPSGLSPDTASIDLPAAEVTMIAEYGAPPVGYIAALSYAVRVLTRKRVLRARVRELNERLLAAEGERDGLLAVMVEALRPDLARTADGKKLLESLGRIEALADEKRTALTGLNDAFDRRATELDDEAAGLAAEQGVNTREVELARGVLAERRHTYDRLDARKKRLYIQVRSVLDVAEKTGQPTPTQAAELAAREAEILAQKPELEQAEREVAAAETTALSAEAVGKDILRRARDVERRRTALSADAQKQIGTHSVGLNEAEAHRSAAAVEAARGVLAARGRIADVPAATLDGIAFADHAVAERATDLERHVRALDAHDAPGLKKGLVAASAIVIAVALVLLFVLTR